MSVEPSLKIYTLDEFGITRDSRPVEGLITRKVEALLIYLACKPDEQTRIHLAELLWEDLPQARLFANLRIALNNLQQHLAPFVIVSRHWVSINSASAYWVDALELEAQLTAAEDYQKVYGELSPLLVRQLTQVLDLYHGQFLSQFKLRHASAFEEWQHFTQDSLHQRALNALQALIDYAVRHYHYPEGLRAVRQLIDLDPLAAEHHQQLMMLLARSGQREAALVHYEAHRRLFQQKLNAPPPQTTQKLYIDILTRKMEPLPYLPSVTHIPSLATPFIPRPAETTRLAALLSRPDCRLITLIGLGGVGKTRLALQAAVDELSNFPDGIFVVDFSAVTGPDQLVYAIAEALKINFTDPSDLMPQIIDNLRDKSILLVLDSLDHVIEEALIFDTLLKAASRLKILATSRIGLNLYGEWLIPVVGMNYPTDSGAESWLTYEAVQLLIDAIQRLAPGFDPAKHRDALLSLCRLTDGVPLFMELAATWIKVMDLEQIAEKAADNLDFLSTDSPAVPPHHRRLRSIFDDSWQMLSSSERETLRKLAVFRNRFTLDAAEKVGCGTPALIATLLKKAMIRRQDNDYTMNELLRQYSYEQLPTAGDDKTTMQSYLDYYVTLVENTVSQIQVGEQRLRRERLMRDVDNLRQALVWASENGQREVACQIEAALGLS